MVFTITILCFDSLILVENKSFVLDAWVFLQLYTDFFMCWLKISAWFCWQGRDKASDLWTFLFSDLLPCEESYSDSSQTEVQCLLQESSCWLVLEGCHSMWLAHSPEAELQPWKALKTNLHLLLSENCKGKVIFFRMKYQIGVTYPFFKILPFSVYLFWYLGSETTFGTSFCCPLHNYFTIGVSQLHFPHYFISMRKNLKY